MNEDCRLVEEIQMVDFFEMYKEKMSCQVIVCVSDKAVCVESDFDALEPLFAVPHDPASTIFYKKIVQVTPLFKNFRLARFSIVWH